MEFPSGRRQRIGQSNTSAQGARKRVKFQRRYARTMFTGLLGLGFTCVALPYATAQSVTLSSLNGTNGFKIKGLAVNDKLGRAVSDAGDINGDGFSDVMVGVPYANFNGAHSGSVYVVFGKAAQTTAALDLATIDGTNGFRIDGELAGDYAGFSLSRAGDFNNDGFDDVLIGCPYCDDPQTDRGSAYVVFGKASFCSPVINLSTLDGTNGLKVKGEPYSAHTGRSVASAGDVNSDGVDDLLIGTPYAVGFNGAAYVLFGKPCTTTSTIELSDLAANDGVRFESPGFADRAGKSVAGAGDINNDGFDDLLIGAPNAFLEEFYSGAVYVVFGRASFCAPTFNLAQLNGTDGFRINGVSVFAYTGASVAKAGDINGDGFADIVVGAPLASHTFSYSGAGYVVFGKPSFTSPEFELSSLDGSNGIVLESEGAFTFTGTSVSGAADVNNDGFDDLIISAIDAPGNNRSGTSYLVFGKSAFTTAGVSLAALDGCNGIKYFGEARRDSAGISVSGAGDVNGDGTPDLIIGASLHDFNGNVDCGASYVVFGPTDVNLSKMKVSLNFAKAAKDSVSMRGALRVPAGFEPSGQQVTVNVGGAATSFTLNTKGAASIGANSVKIKIKSKGGVVEEQDAPITMSFKKGDFASSLADDGLINADRSAAPVGVQVFVSLADKLYHAVAPLTYSAKQDKAGKAK